MKRTSRGVTLIELLVAVTVLTVGVLGFFGAFQFISKSLYISRSRTLATNLAQERVEALKNISYYQLLITTSSAVDGTVSPPITYDTVNYPPETIWIGGITFTRYTFVALAQIDNNAVSTVTFTYPDTGMKQITSHIVWSDLGVKRKWSLTNLLENPNVNPLDSTLYGNVTKSTGGDLEGAYVRVEQNPDWNESTDALGDYSFRVYHGSYTVKASSAGYYDAVSPLTDVGAGSSVLVDLVMTPISSGTIKGLAWMQRSLVISQVVVSTIQADQGGFRAQFVELYNPTTYPINIGPSGTPNIKLNFESECSSLNLAQCTDATEGIRMTYVSTYVAPGSYFVMANTNTFTVAGTSYTADAVYTDDATTICAVVPAASRWNLTVSPKLKQMGGYGHNGTYWITDAAGNILDAFGWVHSGNSDPPNCESACAAVSGGLSGFPDGEQVVRVSSPLAGTADIIGYGRAFDSDTNRADFIYDLGTILIPPRPSTMSFSTVTNISGVAAFGANVAASDPHSGSTRAATVYLSSNSIDIPIAQFSLVGVSTGTWEVVVATDDFVATVSSIVVVQGQDVWISSATTDPPWQLVGNNSVWLTSTSVSGFVTGRVTDITGQNLSGIDVLAGGTSKTTGPSGLYFAMVSTGGVVVIANPGNANPSYIEKIAIPTVNSAQIVIQDFMLNLGGAAQGYLTSGTSPLPNFTVTANIGALQYGTGASNTSGVFTIRNLSTGTYTVLPVLEAGQAASPASITATVSSTGTVFIGTFTVSGAFGNIVGTVTNSATSELVTSGALVLASTAPIASTPPTIAGSTAPALTPLYAVSSKADGTYSLPVRGNSTYYLSVYVPEIQASGSVTTSTKTFSGILVYPSQNSTQNVTIP